MSTEAGNKILKMALISYNAALNELIGACLDEDGKPKQPDHRAIAKARGCLIPSCTNSYQYVDPNSKNGDNTYTVPTKVST